MILAHDLFGKYSRNPLCALLFPQVKSCAVFRVYKDGNWAHCLTHHQLPRKMAAEMLAAEMLAARLPIFPKQVFHPRQCLLLRMEPLGQTTHWRHLVPGPYLIHTQIRKGSGQEGIQGTPSTSRKGIQKTVHATTKSSWVT